MSKEAAAWWMRGHQWTSRQAAWLFSGRDPKQIDARIDLTGEAHTVLHEITHVSGPDCARHWDQWRPVEWFKVALDAKIAIPDALWEGLEVWRPNHPESTAAEPTPEHRFPQPREPQSTAAGTPGTESNVSDTGGMVAWQAVLLESWPTIVAAHGSKPAARKVLKWIKDNGPQDTIPKQQPCRESLRWIDFAGNPHTVMLKTLSTRLSEWRKNGRISG